MLTWPNMALLGFGKTQIPYDMFSLERNAEEAKRYATCERIYHKGQVLAWDGKEILPMLIAKHGAVRIAEDKKESLKRIFAIILWGEMAAWKISAQLADRIEPLEARMAATSQAFDEARHFYTMYDYLKELDYIPERLDPAPQRLLDLTLETDNLAHKLLGMQLLIETIALAIFQEVRELEVEPVLSELMRYYERDEARHVALGMQYLPELMKDMNRLEVTSLFAFQARLICYALIEVKVLEKDLRKLGIDPRRIVERAKAKQALALRQALEAVGVDMDKDRNYMLGAINAGVEFLVPTPENRRDVRRQARAAWRALFEIPNPPDDALDQHARHEIKTARGSIAEPGSAVRLQ